MTRDNKRLKEAAEPIAREARAISSAFSRRIPASTRVVENSYGDVYVETDGAAAPNAAPFQFAENHPVFGNRDVWVKQPWRPYMTEAAAEGSDEAVKIFALKIDDELKRRGWRK